MDTTSIFWKVNEKKKGKNKTISKINKQMNAYHSCIKMKTTILMK